MCAASRPRVLIADDHVLVAEAFKQFLARDFEVVAVVHDGRSLIQAAHQLLPDVVLVDLGMPLLNGLDAAERIKRTAPDVKIIFVTVDASPELVAEAFRRGASGYLLKDSAGSDLVAAIRCALRGERFVSSSVTAPRKPASPSAKVNAAPSQLTERQRDVLQLLAEGRSMKEVASVLALTTRTVAFHKYRIMENLGLRNNAEVMQYAMREHLVFARTRRPAA
jgi:DNA-binding NarL/FixJ family response regulator